MSSRLVSRSSHLTNGVRVHALAPFIIWPPDGRRRHGEGCGDCRDHRGGLSRRAALKGLGAGSVFGLFGCSTTGLAPGRGDGSAPLTFAEVGRSTDGTHHVAAGYTAQVLIRQGDPIHRGGPQYRPGQQTGAEQEQQFGTDNDFIAYMPLPRGSSTSTRGLLGVNHENHRPLLCFPGVKNPADLTREQCEVQMAAQGHSIIEIEKRGNAWSVVEDSPGTGAFRRTPRSASPARPRDTRACARRPILRGRA